MGAQPSVTCNHFVPRFATRAWLLDLDYFYQLSRQEGQVRVERAGPKSFGSEDQLYSQQIELAFGAIENRVAPKQRKLERGELLSLDERHAWAMWLFASYMRTPLAMLHSAEANQAIGPFRGDLFQVSSSRLVSLASNPHCIKLVADRQWEVLQSKDPIWLKPDTGLVLTDRLDADGCLIIYPLSPFACFLASGCGPSYRVGSVTARRAAGLNRQILRWAERSVACAAALWHDRRRSLDGAVRNYIGAGEYTHPTGGKFFAPEGLDLGSSLELMLLAPRGPVIMTVPKSAVRNVPHPQPKIAGLCELDKLPELALKVRLSDDESEIDFRSAAIVMCEHGRSHLALEYARKTLQRNPQDLTAKLIILQHEPSAPVGDLTPQSPLDASDMALWLARVKQTPLEGLKLSSSWLARFPEHEPLVGANFLCAFMAYGIRLLDLMVGRGSDSSLPYIEDSMPLPDGIIEFLKRTYSSGKGVLVEDIQGSLADMDHRETGLAADILRICGCNARLRFYRDPDEAPNSCS